MVVDLLISVYQKNFKKYVESIKDKEVEISLPNDISELKHNILKALLYGLESSEYSFDKVFESLSGLGFDLQLISNKQNGYKIVERTVQTKEEYENYEVLTIYFENNDEKSSSIKQALINFLKQEINEN